MMPQLLPLDDLVRSLGENTGEVDSGLAQWAITTASVTAQDLTGRVEWQSPEDTPAAVQVIICLAARRLYTNPDRQTYEREGDSGIGLDSSVTDAAVFTPSEEKRLLRFATDDVRAEERDFGVLGTRRGDSLPRVRTLWGW